MTEFCLGVLTGALMILGLMYCPPKRILSRLKRYCPWIKPAPVIKVDFKQKRKIK